jgi:hypothetical protein
MENYLHDFTENDAGSILPQLIISDGTLEALKWLGLILMTGDHINKYLFNGTLPVLYEGGRLALPLFVFVLAYNLARPGILECGAYSRTMVRLMISDGIATPLFIALGGLGFGGFWPLNIMFTLLALTGTCYLVEKGLVNSAFLVFLVGGSLCEFLWPALSFGIAIWSYCKRPSWAAIILASLACEILGFINLNMWAMAALPVIFVANFIDLRIPRLRLLFYIYYPMHLGLLLLIRVPMRRSGYLFFM